MALVHTNFYSEVLGLSCSMDVILPQKVNGVGLDGTTMDPPYPVLWLLHGGTDDHTIWQRRTSIERYVSDKGIAVVMPSTLLGFYTDMKFGLPYYTFFAKELKGLIQEFFPSLSDKREDTFVAGLSMGGYGAFKLAFDHPEMFSAAASLSGALDIERLLIEQASLGDESYYHIYGTPKEAKGSDNDLFTLADRLIESGGEIPKLYQVCGTEDSLYADHLRFKERYEGKLPITFYEEPGIHDWAFWDRNIQRVLDFLPVRGKGGSL